MDDEFEKDEELEETPKRGPGRPRINPIHIPRPRKKSPLPSLRGIEMEIDEELENPVPKNPSKPEPALGLLEDRVPMGPYYFLYCEEASQYECVALLYGPVGVELNPLWTEFEKNFNCKGLGGLQIRRDTEQWGRMQRAYQEWLSRREKVIEEFREKYPGKSVEEIFLSYLEKEYGFKRIRCTPVNLFKEPLHHMLAKARPLPEEIPDEFDEFLANLQITDPYEPGGELEEPDPEDEDGV